MKKKGAADLMHEISICTQAIVIKDHSLWLNSTSLVVSPMDDAQEFEGKELVSTSAQAYVATIRY